MLTPKHAQELDPLVHRSARVLSRKTGLDEDEAQQEIWLGILETANRRGPEFLRQKPCYIVQGGVFWARNEWRKRHQKTRREIDLTNARGMISSSDILNPLVSAHYVKRLMHRLSGDRTAKALVAGVIKGEKRKEIARRCAVSPQAISAARVRLYGAMESLE